MCEETGYTGDTYCKDCGAKLESGSETNQLKPHKYDEGTVTKKATCTEDGVLTKKCSVCDAETTEVIKAIGHTEVVDKAVAPTCTKDGLTEGKHCSECNAFLIKQETVKATGHNWDNGKVTKEPTVSAEEVKTFTCTNPGCKETKTEAIAKLPEPKKNEVIEDKTGNDYKVTKVDDNAFNGCKKLKTIIIKSTKLTDKSVAKNAFKGLSKNTVIKVPKKKLKAYKKLFKKKGFKGKVKTI